MDEYPSFAHAYVAAIDALLRTGQRVAGAANPRSIASGFGTGARPIRELQGYGFRISNPRRRALDVSPRAADRVFPAANLIFTLAGGHEPEMISAYNPRGRQFTEDDSRYEAAFGARLFSPGHQLAHGRMKLADDLFTRRALAMIYDPEDTLMDRRDTPCAIGLQFFARDGRLDCVCFMRAQSALMVMPYDVHLFTMLQEWLAVELGLELGAYTHVSGSFHLYEDEAARAEQLLQGVSESCEMPPMSSAGPEVARWLIDTERRWRLGGGSAEPDAKLDAYWSAVLAPVAAFWSRVPDLVAS